MAHQKGKEQPKVYFFLFVLYLLTQRLQLCERVETNLSEVQKCHFPRKVFPMKTKVTMVKQPNATDLLSIDHLDLAMEHSHRCR